MENHSSESKETRRGRGIYLLPNLFTTATLFAGFYAIVSAMNGRFEASAVAIFIAMFIGAAIGLPLNMMAESGTIAEEIPRGGRDLPTRVVA